MDRIHLRLQRHAHILVSLSLFLPLLVVRDADSALSEEREKGSPSPAFLLALSSRVGNGPPLLSSLLICRLWNRVM